MAKLFMAEDDPLMSRMYERAFRLSGHELTIAHDGEEALQMLQTMEPKPAVILLDIMMPKKSGFDVLRAIKVNDALKNIPTMLLTNLAGQQDAEKGLQLGAAFYLVKSEYNPKQVVEKVESMIGKTSPPPPATPAPQSPPPPAQPVPPPAAPATPSPAPAAGNPPNPPAPPTP